ncbi:MAG TPA: GtrA family protein [Sphingopyxis sp.]|nr:GtrA family protein [Sphingopyxis sp.]
MIARPALAYGAVSATCLVLHNAVMIGGDWLGWPYFGSILVSFSLSAVTGYVLHSLVTFGKPISMRHFARYAIAMAANIPLAFVAIWIWHDIAGLAMLWASPIATICMIAVNFLLSRWAILSQSTRMI